MARRVRARLRRERAKLQWTPVWEGPTKQWALGFIRKNKWRCDPINSIDDLLQDSYLTFLKISTKYPRVIGQAHFMTLFRTAMRNEMHDRARYMRRKRERHLDTSIDAFDLGDRIGELSHNGYLAVLLDQAPAEVRAALTAIGQNSPALHRINGHRENLNMKLSRVTGMPLTDLVFKIERLLEG